MMEKAVATHSSVLAWRIPGMGEPGGLPSMGSQSRTQLKRLISGSDRETFAAVNHTSPSPLPEVCFAENSWGSSGFLKPYATHLLSWACNKTFSALRSNVLILLGLTILGTWVFINTGP